MNMREGVRERREKGADRSKGTDVGGRGSRRKRNEMDVITVKNKKNVLITVMRGDGETTGEIGCSPLTARDGTRTSRVGRKSGGRRSKARANTRRTRRRDHGAQTRLRDFLSRGRDTLTEGVEMSERSREGEWGISRDKFRGEVRDINPAFGESTSEGRQRG